jgi:DNA-binding XRE family transcriptional regulator
MYLFGLICDGSDMRNTTGVNSQWLLLEMRLCRGVFGLSQREMGEVARVGLQTIKNMEKAGANPRFVTLNKLRDTFRWLGVKFHLNDDGSTAQSYSGELTDAFDSGRLAEYLKERVSLIHEMGSEPAILASLEW